MESLLAKFQLIMSDLSAEEVVWIVSEFVNSAGQYDLEKFAELVKKDILNEEIVSMFKLCI